MLLDRFCDAQQSLNRRLRSLSVLESQPKAPSWSFSISGIHLKKETELGAGGESKVTREFLQQIMSKHFLCGALAGAVSGKEAAA